MTALHLLLIAAVVSSCFGRAYCLDGWSAKVVSQLCQTSSTLTILDPVHL